MGTITQGSEGPYPGPEFGGFHTVWRTGPGTGRTAQRAAFPHRKHVDLSTKQGRRSPDSRTTTKYGELGFVLDVSSFPWIHVRSLPACVHDKMKRAFKLSRKWTLPGKQAPAARIHGAPNGPPMKCGRKVQGGCSRKPLRATPFELLLEKRKTGHDETNLRTEYPRRRFPGHRRKKRHLRRKNRQ